LVLSQNLLKIAASRDFSMTHYPALNPAVAGFESALGSQNFKKPAYFINGLFIFLLADILCTRLTNFKA
jgi:hypothetical protein